jgi:hypothetical protein
MPLQPLLKALLQIAQKKKALLQTNRPFVPAQTPAKNKLMRDRVASRSN